MIRKLILLAVMAVAALAVAAPAASANEEEVVVENPGMFEIEGENTIAIVEDVLGSHLDLLRCQNAWEVNVDSTGHFDIHNVEIDAHPGSAGNCGTANDCNNAGWTGEIEEDEVAPEFVAHTTFCLSGTGLDLDNTDAMVECEVTDAEAHCDTAIPGFPGLEVEGEVTIHPDPVTGPPGLMHAL